MASGGRIIPVKPWGRDAAAGENVDLARIAVNGLGNYIGREAKALGQGGQFNIGAGFSDVWV